MDLARPLPPALAQLSQARQTLEVSRDLSEVRAIRDTAQAAETYARARKLGEEAERYAAEIVARATRRIGELLTETPPEKPGPKPQLLTAPEGNSPRKQVGWKVSAASQQLAEMPEPEFEAALAQMKRPSVSRLLRIQRDRQAEQARETRTVPATVTADLRHGDFREVLADLRDVDAVITDPPYPREFLPLLADLAAWSDKVLTPDGVLAVLMGQTHLPEVYRLLGGGRPYRWTACYLTPANGYVSHSARVQTNWKPLLVYGGGPRFSDVFRSDGDDAAKQMHHWGQNYAGFRSVVERLTLPGQHVADPFMGSGTTGAACLDTGRSFTGCDVDAEAVATARRRLA